jgi:hypothetical protein
MDYDEAKDEAIALLSAVLDKGVAVVRTAFLGHGMTAKVKKIDYAAQVIVFTFPDMVQPTSDLVDQIGAEVRHLWPDAPAMTATFFKVSSQNSDLVLDFNWPSGIKALADSGDLQALFAVVAEGETLPTLRYVIDKQEPRREPGMLTKHERPV